MRDPELKAYLDQVTIYMASQLPSSGHLAKLAQETVCRPGKLLRPALLYLSAPEEADPLDRLKLGSALEFIHLASLVHDDIVDQGSLRRGRPSVVAAHGPAMALYLGDYLVAVALQVLASSSRHLTPARPLNALLHLAEAEAGQWNHRYNWDLPLSAYEDRMAAKTGSLFGLAALGGALLQGSNQEEQRRWQEAGEAFGIAFQIRDDWEDLTREDLADAGQGNLNYPLALAFQEDGLRQIMDPLRTEAAWTLQVRQALKAAILKSRVPSRLTEGLSQHLTFANSHFREAMSPRHYTVYEDLVQDLFGGFYEIQRLR